MPDIYITLTPDELKNIPDKGVIVVVIDTLRASTTIVTALANGARKVIPFATSSKLQEYYRKNPSAHYMLCGEKGGEKIPGFDLGNSPSEISPGMVMDKIMLIKTTNGTRVLEDISSDNRVYIGALVNSCAVVEEVKKKEKDVYLVCAGTRGKFSLEDFFAAGRFSSLLMNEGWNGGDLEFAAARIFEDNSSYQETINLFHHSQNGQNLRELGYKEDIKFAARRDIFSIVPYWDGIKIRISRR
ncbi:2-phosphosulfolactate phosphatase [Halothermothrix orenii]|uniref:Probable 2-phosphosulfolactate phosphatase n=1 Tax=Halothermothrix orenii (strain H 168 / OCM 544 / DSM 9562) TaxID=373903 RepID=B8D0I8_HALOH|nr:2-phosphosulfolactate phosphatase [Halothermothrix orenii]ACL70924.1 2-phosphosulfolactate phosphatase [Halothermothrix orenii H 168]